MNDNKALVDRVEEIVAALRCCGNTDTKRPDCEHCPLNGYMCVKRMLEGAADLIKAQAAQLAAVTAERDAARRALRLSIETHSVEPRQVERLEQYYLKQACGPQGAGRAENDFD